MNFDFRICVAAAALLGFAAMASTANAQPVSGSFQATCRNIRTFGSALTADCRDPSGRYHTSSIDPGQCRGDIGNDNGVLFCNRGGADNRGGDNRGFAGFGPQGSQVSGSYQRTCRNVRMNGGMLSADCADSSGRYRGTSLAYSQCRGDIGNANGTLFCNGANQPGGQQGGGDGRGNGQGFGRQR